MQYEPFDENILLQQLARGSQEAFAQLFIQYKDKIFHITSLYTKDRLIAEEIVQEVFLTIWTKKEQAATIKDFKSWVFIVTRNQVIKYLEKWAHNKSLEQAWAKELLNNNPLTMEPVAGATLQKTYEHYLRLLEEAIHLLPAQQQAVFRLAKEEHLSYQAIAARLDVSPLTVKTHMQRAYQFIRKHFSHNGGAEFSMLLLVLAHLY